MPRLKGSRTTAAPAAAARSAVASSEPSSITTTSSLESKARSSRTTPPTASSSSRAGTTARRRSGTRACLGAEADEREQLPRAVRVGVLVEYPLACPRAHRLRLRGVVEQPAVGGDGLVAVADDEQ